MAHRRWILLAGLGIAVGAAIVTILLRPLAVTVAARAPLTRLEVFGLGTVEARIVSRLGFDTAGTISELHTDVGERVSRGQVLARLRSDEQAARHAVATAAVVQAQAAVAQAEATRTRAVAQSRQRQLVSQRRQELLRRGTISDEIAQDALTGAEMAAAEADQAASAVAVAEANLDQARAALALEAARLEKHALRAPFDAIVTQRHRELGSAANPGEPIVSLVDPATVWVLAHVDEAAAGSLAPGQSAEIRLRSLPRAVFRGRIERIDVESDRVTEERRVYLACDDCPRDFFLGEQAEVLIAVGELRDALLLPRMALLEQRGHRARAWALRDGRIVATDVTLGARTLDGRIEVTSPLQAGMALIAVPLGGDPSGKRARVATTAP